MRLSTLVIVSLMLSFTQKKDLNWDQFFSDFSSFCLTLGFRKVKLRGQFLWITS